MKRNVIILIFIVGISAMNILSKTNTLSNNKYINLIETALGENGETGLGCYTQVETPTYIEEGDCILHTQKSYDCWLGSSVSCEKGTYMYWRDFCEGGVQIHDSRITIACN